MQLLYVVNFSIIGDDAYNRVLRHISTWLSNKENPLQFTSLLHSGQYTPIPGKVHNQKIPRQAEWSTLSHSKSHAIKLIVSQHDGSDMELTTRVTLGEDENGVQLRIGIGRKSTSNALVPVTRTDVFQPRLIRLIDHDNTLKFRVNNQAVDGKFQAIKSLDEAKIASDSMASSNRLPLTIIHLQSPNAWELAHELSRKLIGLTRILTVNYVTARAITEAHPGANIPFGGLILFWPGMQGHPLRWTAEQIAAISPRDITTRLTERLGSLSALRSGRDTIWDRIRRDIDDQHMNKLLAQAYTARERRDSAGEIEALKQQVKTLNDSNDELSEIGEEAMRDADQARERCSKLENQLEHLKEQLETTKQEAAAWRNSYQDIASSPSEKPIDPWDAVPKLTSHSNPNKTYLAISDASGDYIAFTERAKKSWESIDYPDPEDMTDKLVKLAQAAKELYETRGRTIPHLDTWFKENYGLNVALTDQTISKFKRNELAWLRKFNFEDSLSLDGSPHVKVRDAVSPNECGRIHFALDSSKNRIVVHHVGVKVYKH